MASLCTHCLHLDDRKATFCPVCGAGSLARTTKDGAVTEIPASTDLPCQCCGETGEPLKLRAYRRNVGMLLAHSVYGENGYYCSGCRLKLFGRYQGLTLLLGWWSYVSLITNFFYVAANFWALAAPPINAAQLGVLTVGDLREGAAQADEEERAFTAAYEAMPAWFDDLTEADLALVLAQVDYYEVLRVDRDATTVEIKAAFRAAARAHHPDTSSAGGDHEMMGLVNDAGRVLCDPKLRHAYDHVDELHAAAEHLPDDNEDVDYQPASTSALAGWRCKSCHQHFEDFHVAVDHAEREHPERAFIDPRDAVVPA